MSRKPESGGQSLVGSAFALAVVFLLCNNLPTLTSPPPRNPGADGRAGQNSPATEILRQPTKMTSPTVNNEEERRRAIATLPPLETVVAQTRIAADQLGLDRTYKNEAELAPFTKEQADRLERATYVFEGRSRLFFGVIEATAWHVESYPTGIRIVFSNHQIEYTGQQGEVPFTPQTGSSIFRPNINKGFKMTPINIYCLKVEANKDLAACNVDLLPEDMRHINPNDALHFDENLSLPSRTPILAVSYGFGFTNPASPDHLFLERKTHVRAGEILETTPDGYFSTAMGIPGDSGGVKTIANPNGRLTAIGTITNRNTYVKASAPGGKMLAGYGSFAVNLRGLPRALEALRLSR